ncbi:hypothetical protein [Hoeflea olei]|nr:hypothetical protein [Hoeflea olei]
MHDIRSFSTAQRQKNQERGYEPPDMAEASAALWVALAAIILIIAGLSLFAHNGLNNGGAPFVITPSPQAGDHLSAVQ